MKLRRIERKPAATPAFCFLGLAAATTPAVVPANVGTHTLRRSCERQRRLASCLHVAATSICGYGSPRSRGPQFNKRAQTIRDAGGLNEIISGAGVAAHSSDAEIA